MNNKLETFLGDSLWRTLIKLLIISLVVGILLSFFNFTAYEVWLAVKNFFTRIYELGFEAFGKVGEYIIGGALLVVPIFLIMRFMKIGKS